MLKTGVKAVVTAGNNAYLTLSDTILQNIKIMRGLNKQVRFFSDVYNIQAESMTDHHQQPAAGYSLIDFAPHGMADEVLDLRGLIVGATGDVDTSIQADVTGAAAQAALIAWEEWRYEPTDYSARKV